MRKRDNSGNCRNFIVRYENILRPMCTGHDKPTVPMGECIVAEWLRTLNLIQYTQAFLDNGYDDLEVCKQIGNPDLDAIGVLEFSHREEILEAVKVLREQGGIAVYFTLESPDYQEPNGLFTPCQNYVDTEIKSGCVSSNQLIGTQTRLTNHRLQLTSLIRNKLIEDDVKLTEVPYITESREPNVQLLRDIASKYAVNLKVHLEDVLERLEEIQKLTLTDREDLLQTGTYVDPMEIEEYLNLSSPRTSQRDELPSHGCQDVIETEEVGRDQEASATRQVVGTFLKNMGIRRSGRKYTYRPYQGDLSASEITMSDDDRINLMILVKEGKISMHDAVETVKHYELARREDTMSPELHSYGRKSSEDHGGLVGPDSASDMSQEDCLPGGKTSSSSSSPTHSSISADIRTAKVYEATGTPVYSPVHGVREKLLVSKPPQSPKLHGSPHRYRKPETDSAVASPKEKKRIWFSPFAKRRGSCDSSKQSPKPKHEGLLSPFRRRKGSGSGSSGAEDHSPKDQRRGFLRCGSRSQSHSPVTVHCETIHVTSSPSLELARSRKSNSFGCATLPHLEQTNFSSLCAGLDTKVASQERLIEFRTFGKSIDQPSGMGSFVNNKRGVHSTLQRQESPHSLTNGVSVSPDLGHSWVRTEVECHVYNVGDSPKQTASDVIAIEHTQKDRVITNGDIPSSDAIPTLQYKLPKRHTPPSGTPPDSQSPKRQFLCTAEKSCIIESQGRVNTESGDVTVIECSRTPVCKPDLSTEPPCGDIKRYSSPDNGVETSPTGTLDSEDLKESKYGSSSTMSVGSEMSPVAERKNKVTKKEIKVQHSIEGVAIGSQSSDEGETIFKTDTNKSTIRKQRTSKWEKDSDRINKTETSIDNPQPEAPAVSSSSSSLSVEEEPVYKGPHVARAYAIADSSPSATDKATLTLKKGDMVKVVSREDNELWTGVCNNKMGTFRPGQVELVLEKPTPSPGTYTLRQRTTRHKKACKRPRPKNVQELLQRLGVPHLASTFLLNGYETLELFRELEEEDLDALQVADPEDRAKLLTAAQMLFNFEESPYSSETSSPSSSQSTATVSSGELPLHLVGGETPTESRDIKNTSQSPVLRGTGHGQSTVHFYDEFSFTEESNKSHSIGVKSRAAPVHCDADLKIENVNPPEDHDIISISNTGQITISGSDGVVYKSTGITKVNEQKTDRVVLHCITDNNIKTESIVDPAPSPLTPKSPKPQIPERTSSLSSSTECYVSSPSSSSDEKTFRDASTQHGESVITTFHSPCSSNHISPEKLVVSCSTPRSKVKTAHIRHLSSSGLKSIKHVGTSPPGYIPQGTVSFTTDAYEPDLSKVTDKV